MYISVLLILIQCYFFIKKYSPINIEWVDSQVLSFTWCNEEDLSDNIATVNTIGYFISQNKDIMTIAGSISLKENGQTQLSSVINIPKKCIKSKTIFSF